MRLYLLFLLLGFSFVLNAQIPPAIQWQKSFGGSDVEYFSVIKPTGDGGYIIGGTTRSSDGDIVSTHGYDEAWGLKTDAAGIVQWKQTYGGSFSESISDIKPTPDGGYIFCGRSNSDNGDVSGNHGGISDAWVVKLSATGSIQWQKCYGGPGKEGANSIELTSDGGYIIGAESDMNGGDVTGHHGNSGSDIWIIKIDNTGNLQWQKTYGGTNSDNLQDIIQTSDGGYILSGFVMSRDGDISCPIIFQDIWIAKLDNTGIIQWQNCMGWGAPRDLTATQDGGFVVAGGLLGVLGDAAIIKFSASGTVQWQRLIVGSDMDELHSIIQLADGSYVAAGGTKSADGDICPNKGLTDGLILHLNIDGTIRWQKTIGGSADDAFYSILATTDGGFILAGYSSSNDGDVTGNHGFVDAWLVKLIFPGIPLLPTVQINANTTTICPGQVVLLTASTTDGGTAPTYQWTINGSTIGTNNDSISLTTINDGDLVQCRLTSSSACVTTRMANSNTIRFTVDPTLNPSNFLPAFAEICDYGSLELKPVGSYKTYTWNSGATTPTIVVDRPGTYWLNVTTQTDCPGSDTIIVSIKDCLKGFYMPTAFTPNNDGRNDILRSVMGGNWIKFKLTIYDRWGNIVFQTTDPFKGWNGKIKGQVTDSQVFVWVSNYQFSGEPEKLEKGTVTLIR